MTTEQETSQQDTGRKTILLVTTADTDILTAERAMAGMAAEDFPQVRAYNPVVLEASTSSLDSSANYQELLQAVADAGVVVLRLLGGKRAMPEAFGPLVDLCHSKGIPLIACPGHQEWDEDLVAACSAPVVEVEAVFAYLMRGGIQNFQNLFQYKYCHSNSRHIH